MLDYEVGSISRHTVSDNLKDASGGKSEVTLARVEVREYQLNRYVKRPHAKPQEIVRHYQRQLAVIGGVTLSQSDDRFSGRYLLSGLPVTVTVEVKNGGAKYEVTTSAPGAMKGDTATVMDSRHRPRHEESYRREASADIPTAGKPADNRTGASKQFNRPANPELWPRMGTRGMTVLLVGPGVDAARAVRFGTSEAGIIARKNSRVRLRVPVLASGSLPVTIVYDNGHENVGSGFLILDAPHRDAAVSTVAPCDSMPGRSAGVTQVSPQPVRPGQLLKLTGRDLDSATHVTFTVAQHEVDPAARGIDPDLVGIDFGASGLGRTAPRWLDTLAANIGRSYGATPSVAGECNAGDTAGYAAIRKTGPREGVVCVPQLALSVPIGLWRPKGSSGDTCDTSEFSVQVLRNATRLH